MSPSNHYKRPMRISITYIIPLLLLLLLMIVALQPARAEETNAPAVSASSEFPPCMAGPHSLFEGKRSEYAQKFTSAKADMQQAAEDYAKNMRDYSADRGTYQNKSNAAQAEYAAAQKAYSARSEETAAAYRTAGLAHQAKAVQAHHDYMSAGCPRADNAGARD